VMVTVLLWRWGPKVLAGRPDDVGKFGVVGGALTERVWGAVGPGGGNGGS